LRIFASYSLMSCGSRAHGLLNFKAFLRSFRMGQFLVWTRRGTPLWAPMSSFRIGGCVIMQSIIALHTSPGCKQRGGLCRCLCCRILSITSSYPFHIITMILPVCANPTAVWVSGFSSWLPDIKYHVGTRVTAPRGGGRFFILQWFPK
jgi:hypothetical protein